MTQVTARRTTVTGVTTLNLEQSRPEKKVRLALKDEVWKGRGPSGRKENKESLFPKSRVGWTHDGVSQGRTR